MSALAFPLLGLVLTLIGGYYLYTGGRRLPLLYHLYTGDPVSIRDLVYHEGPVEVEGTARIDEDCATAVFSGTDCLAYEYEVQEYQSSGNSSSWQTLKQGGRAVPFLVEDATGSVLVEPTAPELHLESWRFRVEGGEEPPERIANFIDLVDEVDSQQQSLNLVITELDYGNDQRFIERRLEPGEPVYVYGTVERADLGEWGSGRVDGKLTNGSSSDTPSPLIISDTSERRAIRRIAKGPILRTLFGLLLLIPGFGLIGSGVFFLL